MPIVRVAACHVSPIFLSAKRTTEKAISLIQTAARSSANVVVFPETYIPAFPIWSSLRPPTENHDLFEAMAKESIYADGEEMGSIRAAARATNTIVSIGFSEKTRVSTANLYNSNMLIGADGDILVHHRKLMPTFFEKLTWSPGDGHGLRVAKTPYGNIGNLICGENTNPLARYTLMAQGEQIHISTWPAVWPTRPITPASGDNTATKGSGEPINYDNVAANRTRAAGHCFEAKCFGVLCSGFLGNDAVNRVAEGSADAESLRHGLQLSSRAASMFLDPTGAQLPAFTICPDTGTQQAKDCLQTEEGILYADMDLDKCIEGKQYHDVVGGYQRLDVFQLSVNRSRLDPVVFTEEGNPRPGMFEVSVEIESAKRGKINQEST